MGQCAVRQYTYCSGFLLAEEICWVREYVSQPA